MKSRILFRLYDTEVVCVHDREGGGGPGGKGGFPGGGGGAGVRFIWLPCRTGTAFLLG